MKQDGKYRFSLQFSADTEEHILVGEFLERMGNRKSAVVISALTDYLAAHPELTSGQAAVTIKVEQRIHRADIEKLVRTIIDERISATQQTDQPPQMTPGIQSALEQDVTTLLGNLNLFL